MKKVKNSNQSGFTLIEAIIAIILMGFIALGLSLSVVQSVQNYVFARQATTLSQKGQLAMARIKKELIDVTAVSYISSSEIDYTRSYSPPSCQQSAGCQFSIKMQNNQILLTGISPVFSSQILIDNVSAFTLNFCNFPVTGTCTSSTWSLETGNTINNLAQAQVSFILTYGVNQTLTFNTTINPRQGSDLNAPRPY
jgi:prepilin-type N-terminal cleavage/methylation domain-containing protein